MFLTWSNFQGKTKVPLPICTAPDGPRTKNGGPPPNYVERYVVSELLHFTVDLRVYACHQRDLSTYFRGFKLAISTYIPSILFVNHYSHIPQALHLNFYLYSVGT